MLKFKGANIIPSLIKLAKIMKAKDQLLIIVSLAYHTLVPCMSRSRLFIATLMGQSCCVFIAQALPC
jgi:hypothetical protein